MKTLVCPFKLLILLILLAVSSNSQASVIETSEDVCIGNLAYFKVKNVQGINSIRWDFGDGFTSQSKSPFHLYKATGQFLVKVEIALSSGTQKDSLLIQVHELPKAALSIDRFDSCFYTNELIIKDISKASGSANPITKRLIVWGDGDFTWSNTSQGDIEKHHYKMMDTYKVKMEITDNKGCKSSVLTHVTIINGTQAKIGHEITYPACGEAEVCFKNNSETTNGSNQVYVWKFDGGTAQSLDFNDIQCFKTSTSKFVTAQLFMSNPDNTCHTTDSIRVHLDADIVTDQLTLNDSIFCYGSGERIQAVAPNGNGFTYIWTLDNRLLPANSNQILALPKELKIGPGYHQITCAMNKGNCQLTFNKTFFVQGPIARMRIFNDKQCQIDDRVFFIDTSLNLNKKHALYYWTVIDPDAPNCEIFRAQNKNKYTNCNFSRDWFGKHDYTTPRSANPIHLTVVDTLVGCSDSTIEYMNHFHCLLCERAGTVNICQGDTFLRLKKDEKGPVSFSLDTGKTWMKFPSQINKPYKGLYGVLFAFEIKLPDWAEDFGDDSIKIHRNDTSWMDTLFVSDFLFVKETMDTALILTIENTCKPYVATIEFVNPNFKAGDQIVIQWKDGIEQLIRFDTDSLMPFVKHVYHLTGLDTFLELKFISYQGCQRTRDIKIRFGKGLRIRQIGNPCIHRELCFEPSVTNWLNDSRYNELKTITWFSEFDPNGKKTNTYCITYPKYGQKRIQLVAEDSLGCVDTLELDLHIRQVKAGIFSDAKISFCSELKQMFDSSYHIYKIPGDTILNYLWDFGSGKYTTLEQNPFRSFDLIDSVIETKHIVVDNNGCTDTFLFDLEIKGSRPQFDLKDTIGCAPLMVKFINQSNKCSSYIWEFDDPENTTLEETSKKDGQFLYTKAGKYYPKLIGIDTFYNPYTGSVYYCHETFDPKRPITVFDTKFARLESPDTICLGQTVTFICDANTNQVNWDFGDGTKDKRLFEKYKSHTYRSEGTFTVRYSPEFIFQNNQIACKDSFSKTITVLDVNADFEIKISSQAPIFDFRNLSTPGYADIWWDFGDPSSNSNTSTDQEPSHNYGLQTGTYTVCLTANVHNKCRDSVCKPIDNNYVQFISLYNVFTPGKNDGLNDEYDVSIQGEEEYHLVIYNRWGVEVYSSDKDGEIGDGSNWNGLVNNTGAACPSGTYYYVFNYSFRINPEAIFKTNGTITLIR